MSHYNTLYEKEAKIHFSRAIIINLKFGAICKRSKTRRMKLSMVSRTPSQYNQKKAHEQKKKREQENEEEEEEKVSTMEKIGNYSGYIIHSISHIKRIFKWLPSFLIEQKK